jgi:hypothetical protein
MPTYLQLMLSNPEGFGRSGEFLETAATGLDSAGAEFSGAVKTAEAGWQGEGRAAQSAAATRLTGTLDMISFAAVQAGATATSGGIQMQVAVTELRTFAENATSLGFLVFPVPLVMPGPNHYAQAAAAGPAAEAVLAAYEAIAQVQTQALNMLVAEATALDTATAARIGSIEADLAAGRVSSRTPTTDATRLRPPPIDRHGNQMPDAVWQRLNDGNAFDERREPYYTARGGANEMYLADGTRLDSYVPGRDIVSRKETQLAEVQPGTAMEYIRELERKYPPGARIADTPANNTQLPGIGEQRLRGDQILEVPPQNSPVPPAVLQYARDRDIVIRDALGRIYT